MAPARHVSLLFALFSQCVAAVTPPDAKKGMTFEIEKVFDVDFSTDSNGGCKAYKDSITNSFYDAVVAVTGALNAIDSVSQITKKSKEHDPIAKKDWLRVRQTYEKVFGVDPWTDAGGLAKQVNPVRKTYDEYLVNLQAPAKDDEKEPPKFSIRCHDGFLKWLEPTDPDPREAGKPDAKKFTLAKPREGNKPFPKGAMHGASLPPQRSLMMVKEWITMKGRTHPICRSAPGMGPVAIFTDYPTGVVVFCKELLERKGLVPTLAQLKPRVGTNIDIARDALSSYWVHEFGHLIKDFQDPQAVDQNGGHVTNYKGERTNVYDWEFTVNYAKCRVDDVPSSPECYRMFAVAMNWKDFCWATGKAKMQPEPVPVLDAVKMKRSQRVVRVVG